MGIYGTDCKGFRICSDSCLLPFRPIVITYEKVAGRRICEGDKCEATLIWICVVHQKKISHRLAERHTLRTGTPGDLHVFFLQLTSLFWIMPIMRSMLCVVSGVFYASKERARRHPWVVGAFCGLWQADIYCPLTPGHDTEHPDSKQHMILTPSS